MTELKGIKIRIYGIVQGVFYRTTAIKEAKELNIVGWIRNRSDSSVECVAEGTKSNLEKFIILCQRGSTHSKVERVDIEWTEFKNQFKEFKIEYY